MMVVVVVLTPDSHAIVNQVDCRYMMRRKCEIKMVRNKTGILGLNDRKRLEIVWLGYDGERRM